MKRLFTCIIQTLLVIAALGQNWQWKNPMPQGNPLGCIRFVDANTGWIVGSCGTILKTANEGAGWVLQQSGTTYDLLSVFFADATPDTRLASAAQS